MAKKRQRKKAASRKHPGGVARGPRPKGYDFGAPFRSMFVGDLAFNQHLINAKVLACGYGFANHEELGATIPSISIVAERPEPLKRAFESFHRWAEMSDDDAVAITIVFLNEGGYLFGLNVDVERTVLLFRLQDIFSDPYIAVVTWVKKMDTRHSFLEKFKKGLNSLVTPFLLDGVTAPIKGLVSSAYRPSDIQQVDGIRPLLKFECTVVSEDDVDPNTSADIILRLHQDKIPERNATPKDKVSPETVPAERDQGLSSDTIQSRRRRLIQQNFPITLARFQNSEHCQALCLELAKLGLHSWQVEQAISNLVLGKQISPKQLHYGSISDRKLGGKIGDAVRNRFEMADNSENLEWVTQEQLTEQVRLDIVALLKALGYRSKDQDLKSLLEQLAKRGLFEDATTA